MTVKELIAWLNEFDGGYDVGLNKDMLVVLDGSDAQPYVVLDGVPHHGLYYPPED